MRIQDGKLWKRVRNITSLKDDADYEKRKEEEDFYKSAIKDYWYDLKKVDEVI